MNRAMALFALVVMVAFFAVFLVRVPRIDLGIVVLLTMALAVYDVWTQIRPRR